MILNLTSNACLDLYPDNTVGNFRITLPSEVKLPGEYEVAVSRLFFPKSWPTVSGDEGVIRLKNEHKNVRHSIDIKIPESNFTSSDSLLNGINRLIDSDAKNMTELKTTRFVMQQDDRVAINMHEHTEINISEKLAAIMGLNTNHINPKPGRKGYQLYTEYGQNSPDILAGTHFLFVYSDLVREQIVSSVRAPLLLVAPTTGLYEDYLGYEPRTLDYLPLRSNQFQTISVKICDINGNVVKFSKGYVHLTLTFRPVSKI